MNQVMLSLSGAKMVRALRFLTLYLATMLLCASGAPLYGAAPEQKGVYEVYIKIYKLGDNNARMEFSKASWGYCAVNGTMTPKELEEEVVATIISNMAKRKQQKKQPEEEKQKNKPQEIPTREELCISIVPSPSFGKEREVPKDLYEKTFDKLSNEASCAWLKWEHMKNAKPSVAKIGWIKTKEKGVKRYSSDDLLNEIAALYSLPTLATREPDEEPVPKIRQQNEKQASKPLPYKKLGFIGGIGSLVALTFMRKKGKKKEVAPAAQAASVNDEL